MPVSKADCERNINKHFEKQTQVSVKNIQTLISNIFISVCLVAGPILITYNMHFDFQGYIGKDLHGHQGRLLYPGGKLTSNLKGQLRRY